MQLIGSLAAALLAGAASGYALANARLLLPLLPGPLAGSIHLRALLIGLLWLFLCLAAALAGWDTLEGSRLWGRALAFFGQYRISGKILLIGAMASLLAVAVRVALDVLAALLAAAGRGGPSR